MYAKDAVWARALKGRCPLEKRGDFLGQEWGLISSFYPVRCHFRCSGCLFIDLVVLISVSNFFFGRLFGYGLFLIFPSLPLLNNYNVRRLASSMSNLARQEVSNR